MSTSLFPFFGDTVTTETEEEFPLYREVAWDFKNNIPVVEKGDFKIVTGKEAIKTWIYKTLKTERFRYAKSGEGRVRSLYQRSVDHKPVH